MKQRKIAAATINAKSAKAIEVVDKGVCGRLRLPTMTIMDKFQKPVGYAIQCLATGMPLSEAETESAFGAVMAGEATAGQMAALLMGLRARGEKPEEVAGAALALRRAMHRISLENPSELVDTCGTGGGSLKTINISTAAALIAAGAGVRVAKHGNRSFTSRSGSADVLEALGVAVDVPAEQAINAMKAAGIAFLYAPNFHPAMRYAGPVRRELGVATIMNLVGPLANPAGVVRQVIGVADSSQGRLMAESLVRLGTEHTLVVHARIGMDEIAPVGLTQLWQVNRGELSESEFDPASVGLDVRDMSGTEGGEPEENAAAIIGLLDNPGQSPVALRSAALLNAAAAIIVAGVSEGMDAAVVAATESLESGSARDCLQRLREVTPFRTSG